MVLLTQDAASWSHGSGLAAVEWKEVWQIPAGGFIPHPSPPPAPESSSCCHQLSCLPARPAETCWAPGAATGCRCELGHVTVEHDVNPLRARRGDQWDPLLPPEPPSHPHTAASCKQGSLGSFPLSQDESIRQLFHQIL